MSSAPRLAWLRRRGLFYVTIFLVATVALLTIEQARTIRIQRALIQDLFQDSMELTARKYYLLDAKSACATKATADAQPAPEPVRQPQAPVAALPGAAPR